ncbi:MAG: hypothetical protein WBD24_07670, partial [Candidatus Omnitrophota bacterium]
AEKIKIYDKGIDKEAGASFDSYGDYLTLRAGDIYLPFISMAEPVRMECAHFLECVRNKTKPFTDGRNGLEVVKILEKAQESLSNNGMPVNV